MLRRLRRPTTVLVSALLLVPALAACGSSSDKKDSSSSSSGGGISGVTITGDVGKEITAKWKAKVAKPSTTKAQTLVKGKGDPIKTGDSVSTYLWVADGTTKKVAYSDYQNGKAESIPNSPQINKVFQKLFDGATYGSRVAAVTNATDLLGSATGGAQLGLGADDGIVVVADFVKKAPVSPKPSSDKAKDVSPSSMPKIVEKAGKPSSLDFSGVSKPSISEPVRRVILKKGTGKAVKGTDTVTVNYLGSTYKAKAPFDASYGKQPLSQPLAQLIQGWKIGLTGVKVGSRVLLEIPPYYGYGAEGSGSTIPGNATLWFVIDVTKASS